MNFILPVYRIVLPTPPIGNKIFCAQGAGIYILEEGPGTWRAMANTHQGTGSLSVYDGIPNKNGQFKQDIPKAVLRDDGIMELHCDFDGRQLFLANPGILGMWMFDAGVKYGLTFVIKGTMGNVSPCVTITWMPQKQVKRVIEDVKI
jgi:hypothetical protein